MCTRMSHWRTMCSAKDINQTHTQSHPGFIVTKIPVRASSAISRPSNWKRRASFLSASWIALIWEDTTDRTCGAARGAHVHVG